MAECARCPRGQVTGDQELCLQVNKEFLAEELDAGEVVRNLSARVILDANDEERILGADFHRLPRREQNGRLVDTVARRGPRGFRAFLQALRDTGHEAAFDRLAHFLDPPARAAQQPDADAADADADADDSAADSEEDDDDDDDDGTESEPCLSGAGSAGPDRVLERVKRLAGTVGALGERMDVLSMRLTRQDGERAADHQAQLDSLQLLLARARAEIDRLRHENDHLSEVVADRSEQLERAREKLEELGIKISELESVKASMQEKLQFQTKRLEQVNARGRLAHAKLGALEKQVQTQKQEYMEELTSHKLHHKRDIEASRRRIDLEKDKRQALESKLDAQQRYTKGMMTRMETKFSEMERQMAELKNAPAKEPTVPAEKGNRPADTGRRNRPRPSDRRTQRTRFPDLRLAGQATVAERVVNKNNNKNK